LSDFKLGTGVVIKTDKDWRGVGQPQVAMRRNSQFSRLVWLFQKLIIRCKGDTIRYVTFRV